jgi:hypothetical protein
METISPALIALIGILLRIGVPILLTVLVAYFLRRLDTRWQEEAQKQMANSPRLIPANPCWEVNHCSPEKKYHCKAFINPEVPCWQQYRSTDGLVRESCLSCSVFRNAPAPVTA